MDYFFRNDQPDLVLSILHEAADWLSSRGQPMWHPAKLTADQLFNEHTRGNAHVLYVQPGEGQDAIPGPTASGAPVPAATFILQWQDPDYFPDVPAQTAGFLHKLAIRRPFAGQHLFRVILDFCQAECRRRHIHELQLETDATRPALLRFYEQYGFEPTYQKTVRQPERSWQLQFFRLRFA